MGLFSGIVKWFTAGNEYRGSLKELIEYLPVGDLELLVAWRKRYIPYRSDTNTGKPEGEYDFTQEYNGADLTIKMRGGDCESIAAVYSEVIRAWKGWSSSHVQFTFIDENTGGQLKAHDVAVFTTPSGKHGWIDGGINWGNRLDMEKFYVDWGWKLRQLWRVNDLGEKLEVLP